MKFILLLTLTVLSISNAAQMIHDQSKVKLKGVIKYSKGIGPDVDEKIISYTSMKLCERVVAKDVMMDGDRYDVDSVQLIFENNSKEYEKFKNNINKIATIDGRFIYATTSRFALPNRAKIYVDRIDLSDKKSCNNGSDGIIQVPWTFATNEPQKSVSATPIRNNNPKKNAAFSVMSDSSLFEYESFIQRIDSASDVTKKVKNVIVGIKRKSHSCNEYAISSANKDYCASAYISDVNTFKKMYLDAVDSLLKIKNLAAIENMDERSRIKYCASNLKTFLNPYFSPYEIATLNVSVVSNTPYDDSTSNLKFRITKRFDTARINDLQQRINAWKSQCGEVTTIHTSSSKQQATAGWGGSNDGRDNGIWNNYFITQAINELYGSKFGFNVRGATFERNWKIGASINGQKIFEQQILSRNPMYLSIYKDESKGGSRSHQSTVDFDWNGYEDAELIMSDKRMMIALFLSKIPVPYFGSFNDERDGKKINTVVIGNQNWMATDLKYSASNSWCCFPSYKCDRSYNDACESKGRLYNWKVAQTSCPPHWHLPSVNEWLELIAATGDITNGGYFLKSESMNGHDSFGFQINPEGYRDNAGNYGNEYNFTGFWTNTAPSYESNTGYSVNFNRHHNEIEIDTVKKDVSLSVRCIEGDIKRYGIGITMGYDDSGDVVIKSIIRNSPAEKSGLQVNDKLQEVCNKKTLGFSTTDIANIIRASNESKVKVLIQRKQNDIMKFEIEKVELNMQQ